LNSIYAKLVKDCFGNGDCYSLSNYLRNVMKAHIYENDS